MILPDANLLIYSVDETSRFHSRARRWWDGVLSAPTPVALVYPTLLAFLRITTNPQIFVAPLSMEGAVDRIRGWMNQPWTTLLQPTPLHWEVLSRLLVEGDVTGNLTTDAHIAAYAIEHGATVYSNDSDFSRFPGLRSTNPLRES